jgi:hypothetical protein
MLSTPRLLLFVASLSLGSGISFGKPVSFNRDIRPILSENCFHCHGPDKESRDSGLRLDVREEATKPAKSDLIAIVPGNVEASELVSRILSEDKDEIMPPPKAHKTLTAEQKDLLKRWIAGRRCLRATLGLCADCAAAFARSKGSDRATTAGGN